MREVEINIWRIRMSLNQLFDKFLGGQQSATDQQPSTGSGGLSGLASSIPGGLAGGLAAGGVLGVLAGSKKMRKTAGKLATGAVGIGGAAALGAVAYKAYQSWQTGQSGGQQTDQNSTVQPTSAAPSGQAPAIAKFDTEKNIAADGQPFQLALVKAMVAASNADGHIDGDEQKSVFDAVNKMQLDAEDKSIIFDTLQNPPSIETVASFANGPEQASEIYLVSRLAIDPDHPSEQAYLKQLARQMSLPDELVAHLESQIGHAEREAA